jgi:hypothetical protein
MDKDLKLIGRVAELEGGGCGGGVCPAVFETTRDSFVVVGAKIDRETFAAMTSKGELPVGDDEDAIEIPRELIESIKNNC